MGGRRIVTGARRNVTGARRGARRPVPIASNPPVPAFPQVPLGIAAQISIDGSWIDVTQYVFGGDRSNVAIGRGRANEGTEVDASRLTGELNNRNGQFSPRNPTGIWYGKIGRNTQLRVMVGADVRFIGEVSEWPQRWDTTGTDVWVPVEAAGILRRLQQGATPLRSTLFRGLTSLANQPKAYWPCEDGGDATEIASGIGGPSMKVSGSPQFSSHTSFKCSAPLPVVNGAKFTGTVPAYANTGKLQIWFIAQIPTSGGSFTAGQQILDIYTLGTLSRWILIYESTGDLRLKAQNSTGDVLDSGSIDFNLEGKLVRIGVQLEQNGADINWSMDTLEVGASFAGGTGGTVTNQTLGQCHTVVVNDPPDLGSFAIGHIAVHSEILDLFTLAGELNAYNGERAGRRIQRLCSEGGITFRGVGDLNATSEMGAQLPGQLVDLLREAATADGGILYEPRDVLGLAYRTRENLYNQTPVLTLDYSAADLSGIEPTDDDQNIRNDVTAKRTGGSSARVVQSSGSLSVGSPPAGVGRYDETVELNIKSDGTLPDRASWLVYLGTTDEARYPTLTVNLARPNFFGVNAPKGTAAQLLDIGDRLVVSNPPAWLPPDAITQLAQGFKETLAQFTHTIDVNCSPESGWGRVGVYEDSGTRYAPLFCYLNEPLDTTETGVDVVVQGPLWTVDDGSFDIRVGGEVMTVTAIPSTVGQQQTLTVIRSVNGVVKQHAMTTEVQLARQAVYAL